MKVKVGIWDRLSRAAVFVLFLAGLVGVFFWYLPLIKQNQRFRQQILALDIELQKQERYGRQLRVTTEALQSDPATLERAAREILGYARSNEIIFRFQPPADPGKPTR